MHMKKYIITVIAIGLTLQSQAQIKAIQQADDLFNGREYKAAAYYFEQIAAQNKKKDNDWIYKIAECYRNLKDYPRAADNYEKLVDQKHVPVDMYLHYAHTLRYLNKQQEAYDMYEKYKSLGGTESVDVYQQGCMFAMQKNLPNADYDIKPTNKVTDGLHLGGCWYNGGLVYAEPRTFTDEKTKYSYPRYELVYTSFADGKFSEEKDFAKNISTQFYLGSPAVSPDGNYLYFTRNGSDKKLTKKKKFATDGLSHQGVNTLHIYMSKKSGDGWSEPVLLELNNPDYSCIHPSLSPDGTRMVFASDKPGGKGGYDLYIAQHHGDGWSNPQHLEDVVNSEGNEMFPYLANDTTLYFSSDGFVGLGGADLFVSHLHNGHWSKPENLGKGFNSAKDDFGLFFSEARKGFFASNRNTEPGKDEIFTFEKKIHYIKGEGEITDKLYLKRIEGVEVDLYEGKTFIMSLYTDRKGDYNYDHFNPEKKYTLHVKKDGYHEQELEIDPASADMLHLDFKLAPIIEKNTVLTFNDILFEYGKADVQGDSRTILKRVTDLLKDNPGAKVELSAHTDSRGSDKANLNLSQRRAQACVDILIANGVDPNNLVAKGYGESKLKNDCGNNKKCTEEEHAINRRVEIKVLDVKVRE